MKVLVYFAKDLREAGASQRCRCRLRHLATADWPDRYARPAIILLAHQRQPYIAGMQESGMTFHHNRMRTFINMIVNTALPTVMVEEVIPR